MGSRETHIVLDGQEIALKATFAASLEIAERVGDPLLIAREAALENLMLASRMPYEPKWRFTIKNVPLVIWIGSKAAGNKHTLEQIQELCFSEGFVPAKEAASDYLASIVGPAPTEIEPGEPDSGKLSGSPS
jgi:hypothetical protein